MSLKNQTSIKVFLLTDSVLSGDLRVLHVNNPDTTKTAVVKF